MTLLPNHLADLRRSGLTDDTIEIWGCRSVVEITHEMKAFAKGVTVPGLALPVVPPGARESSGFVYKPDNPRVMERNGKKRIQKYELPRGGSNRIHVPRAAQVLFGIPDGREGPRRMVLTEGSKKAEKAVQEGIPCVALSGVWNWFLRFGGESIPIDENYGRFFQEYLRQHKINLKLYTATKGYEYVRGGIQLCVLHQDGQPTPLQDRLKLRLRPLHLWDARQAALTKIRLTIPVRGSRVATKSLRMVSVKPQSRGGGALRTGGLLAFDFLLQIGAAYLAKKCVTEPRWEKEMTRIAPTIEAELAKLVFTTANQNYNDLKAYAVITLTVRTTLSSYVQLDKIEAVDVTVSSRQKTGSRDISGDLTLGDRIAMIYDISPTSRTLDTYSFEIASSAEHLELYRRVVEELDWFSKATMSADSEAIRKEFLKDRQEVIDSLAEGFGVDASLAERHLKDILLL